MLSRMQCALLSVQLILDNVRREHASLECKRRAERMDNGVASADRGNLALASTIVTPEQLMLGV
jgi:hypothetical protein